MFNLFRSREKSVRILLGALLMVVAVSMLTYLVPQYNTGAPTADTVVASVGRDDITSGDVMRLIQATMRGKQLPPELISTYVPQMVDEMVNERALAYEATRLGFEVSDADLSASIQQIIPNLFPDGKFAGKDAYAAVLTEQQLTIPEFETNLRREILITKLREVAVEGTIVSELEIEHAYRERNEKIKIQYVKVSGDKYRAEINPSAKDVETFFQVNQANYKVPESRNLAILIADQAKIAESLVPTDADLLRMYNLNKEQFRTKERVHAQHILLKTSGKPPAEDAKMKALAADLLKQIQGGANFADLAKKYSEDTGSAAKGGDLDWIERGQTLLPRNADAAGDQSRTLNELLRELGFDSSEHEQIRADLRRGRIGLAQNRLPASADIRDVEDPDVFHAENGAGSRYQEAGMEALRRGRVAVVSLAGGIGTRWTRGAGVVKALNPFAPFAGRHRNFIEVHLAKTRRTNSLCGTALPHVITTSYLTHEAIADWAGHERLDGANLFLSPGRSVGLRLVPMARDLKFVWEETPQQILDEQAESARKPARRPDRLGAARR